ncbi:hypothetical protein [Paenibacillus sp. MSJ-34]|uniref:5'-methylthioadenosine/S-adenosylhomocysteine nucleosidase family protein n=1 Tax=Paenibacillus sp. MSJ-34 TaxID=2841529 RepID=UPI001C0FAAAB|nr:hypothetical protein [Paenibacillus sp. MSJ-34]MBU5442343.1 hypothetical protein [Paenibacillus sp. MSJ-34]
MIYIAVALYCEAKPIIEYYQLKKLYAEHPWQQFAAGDIRLIVTGTGPMQAAIGVASLLSRVNRNKRDLLINVGIAGTAAMRLQVGRAVLCHKIVSRDTSHVYYPDVLIRHRFDEGVLETFSRPVTAADRQFVQGELVDMEAAGCLEAAKMFLAPHQTAVVKIVSDALESSVLSPERVSGLIAERIPDIDHFISSYRQAFSIRQDVLDETDEKWIEAVRSELRLSETMAGQLKQMAVQYKIRTGQPLDALRYDAGQAAESKQEGKMRFAQLRQQLLYE